MNRQVASTMDSPSNLRVLTDEELADVNGGLSLLHAIVAAVPIFAVGFLIGRGIACELHHDTP